MKILRFQFVPSILVALILLDSAAAQTADRHTVRLLGRRSHMTGGGPPAVLPSPRASGATPFEAAYARLSVDDKAQFDRVMQMTSDRRPGGGSWTATMFRAGRRGGGSTRLLTGPEQDLLRSLLVDGTLGLQSQGGQTILDHLAGMIDCTPTARREPWYGKHLARDLIRMLGPVDRLALRRSAEMLTYYTDAEGKTKQYGIPIPGGLGEITQCPVHFTCGAASMQVWMRLECPAELVRIARELHCMDQAEVRGSTLRPARRSTEFHAGALIFENDRMIEVAGLEDRCDLDILLQSSLMDKVSIGNLSAYDVHLDSGGAGNVMRGNSGGHPLYIKRELERLAGRSFEYQHSLNPAKLGGLARFLGNLKRDTMTQEQLVAHLDTQTAGGRDVLIAYQTNPKKWWMLHYVTVLARPSPSDKFVLVDTCEAKAERSKIYTLTRTQLLDSLRCVIHPR